MSTIGVTVSDFRQFPEELALLKDRHVVKIIKPGQLGRHIARCDILYLWSLAYDELRLAMSSSDKLPALLYIPRQGEDDWIIREAKSKGMTVGYAKGVFSNTIAEYTLAALLMMAKNLHRVVVQGTWEKQYSERISGSKALILGRGDIATQTEALFGNVGISTKKIGHQEVDEIARGSVSDTQANYLQSVNHVVCCLPHSEETTNILNLQFFSYFRNITFINVSRGEVLEMNSFKKALDNSHIRVALLDAFSEEPLDPTDSLWDDDRVIVSPHHSYRSYDWAQRLHRSFMKFIEQQ